MEKDEKKSKKGWEIFLVVLGALLSTVFTLALTPSNSTSQSIPGGQQSAIKDFFTISTNIATPILITGLIIAAMTTLLFLLRLLDLFDFFDLFDSDFWDFL